MTNEPEQNDSESQDDWDIYLQVFLDESDEDLESLSQALLRMENDSGDSESLNEAFRLLHTHKGSAGLMGFEGISLLAHELESRFDHYRSNKTTLDRELITGLLRCVDFLRAFNQGLRAGQQPDQDASSVLHKLEEIERRTEAEESNHDELAAALPISLPSLHGGYRVRVEFEDGLQLVDMKARLIVARLSNVGEIVATDPPVDDMQSCDDLSQFVLIVLTDHDPSDVREIANVDGVKNVQIEGRAPADQDIQANEPRQIEPEPQPLPLKDNAETGKCVTEAIMTNSPNSGNEADQHVEDRKEHTPNEAAFSEFDNPDAERSLEIDVDSLATRVESSINTPTPSVNLPEDKGAKAIPQTSTSSKSGALAGKSAVAPTSRKLGTDQIANAGTVRVGIDRLDSLMNLTGELVVTRARLVQITGDMNPMFHASRISNLSTDLTDQLRVGLKKINEVFTSPSDEECDWQKLLNNLAESVNVLEKEFADWESGCQYFTRIEETVDQLSRVSDNLQQSVLDTRMVPVSPLFNRFRRVIRDLAAEQDKQIQLEIHGEKTELDKRMIDELGDPLLHLIRNSIDHGLEPSDQRRQQGKPEAGTIVLEASHRGNNVFIAISDDGSGLNVERIRHRVLESGLASETALNEMGDQQIIDHIWSPGFSTAKIVTDISGRGVGLDVVKNRIAELNGSINVETKAGQGVTFNLRLPLTLAIIRCLLVRFRTGVFSIPIDDVREIVSVGRDQIHAVHGGETIDVRGEFIHLVRMDRVFYWRKVDCEDSRFHGTSKDEDAHDHVNVVILHVAGRTIGLCVEELCGSADIVIKSLSENFVDIQGLSGASIMGDGTVCLMLDTSEVIKMAANRSTADRPKLPM